MSALTFKAVPRGFYSTNDHINSLTESQLNQIVSDILSFHSKELDAIPTSTYQTSLTPSQLKSVINALLYIFRTLITEKIKGDNLPAILKKESELSQTSIGIIQTQWTQISKDGVFIGRDTSSPVKSILRLPHLLSLSWKLGVSLSSSQCKVLSSPFVTVQFTTAANDAEGGTVSKYTIDCTLTELKELTKAFNQMYQALETV